MYRRSFLPFFLDTFCSWTICDRIQCVATENARKMVKSVDQLPFVLHGMDSEKLLKCTKDSRLFCLTRSLFCIQGVYFTRYHPN